jgi:hypothetical protein
MILHKKRASYFFDDNVTKVIKIIKLIVFIKTVYAMAKKELFAGKSGWLTLHKDLTNVNF